MRFDTRDVGHPHSIWRINFKLPIQGIVSNDSGLPSVTTRATFTTNLSIDKMDQKSSLLQIFKSVPRVLTSFPDSHGPCRLV